MPTATTMRARRLPVWALAASALVIAAWAGMLLLPMSHGLSEFSAAWLVMIVAMMVPTVARPMMRISQGEGSRAFAFMLGYVALWMLSLPIALIVMRAPFWSTTAVLLLWVAVGVYQLLPSTASHLRRCRSLDATASPSSLGARQGIACMIACLPLMITVMLSVMVWDLPTLPAAMLLLAAAVFMVWEKSPSVSRTMIRASGITMVLASVLLFTIGLGTGTTGHVHDNAGQASGVSKS